MAPPRVVVAAADPFFRDLCSDVLLARGFDVAVATTSQEVEARLARGADLVIAAAGQELGPGLLERIRSSDPDLELLAVAPRDDVRGAVAAMRAGAGDCLVLPIEREELALTAERALERVRVRRERRKLLDENVEFLKHQALYRRCLDLLSTVDRDRLHEVALEVLAQVVNARAGAIWATDGSGALVLRAWRGPVDRAALPKLLDPCDPAITEKLASGAPFPVAGAAGDAFQLPLLAAGELHGLVLLSDRGASGGFRTEDAAAARTIADFAAVALRNARRFADLEGGGLRDRESAAYNLSFFLDYAAKEAYKARRYGRVFSVLVLRLDNLLPLRRVLGATESARITKAVLATLTRIARQSDVVAKVAEDEIYVLLPETDRFGAMMFQRRVAEAVQQDHVVREATVRLPLALSAGTASFPRDGEDLEALLHHCRRRGEEARRSLVRRLQLGELDFWQSLELLLRGGPLPSDAGPGASRRFTLDDAAFRTLQSEIARELASDPGARALLYVGAGTEPLHELAALRSLPEGGGHAYLLGRRGGAEPRHPAVTPVYLESDERIARHEFVLLLSERSAYALVRESGDGASPAFHTSDAPLVDHLVGRLQAAYDLQPC